MKKLINDPFDFVDESLEGFVHAHGRLVRRAGRRVVARRDGPVAGKVGVVIGGGSGHLPAFAGYVGRGGADAVPIGNVFASPPARPVLEATLAADGGQGVLYSYGNYAGDVMNFDRAAVRAGQQGIEVRTVLVTDDVASAPKGSEESRRGIAGGFFVFKVAAAAAEAGLDLAGVEAAARHANANVRTMGVGLSACTVPANGKPTFALAEDEAEIGLGIHGEPGVRKAKLPRADDVADELCAGILADLDFAGRDAALLVNGLGATPLEELYVLHRRAVRVIREAGVNIVRSYVGEYVTSLEMAGASLSLLRLDDELLRFVDAPADCASFTQSEPAVLPAGETGDREEQDGDAAGTGGDEAARALLTGLARRIEAEKDRLCDLDSAAGDGDHGVSMTIGMRSARRELERRAPRDAAAGFTAVADAFAEDVGASVGPLYDGVFRALAEAFTGNDLLSTAAWSRGFDAAATSIMATGGARPGDKTMLDAWHAAAGALRQALDAAAPQALEKAAAAAWRSVEETRDLLPRLGRASRLGERARGLADAGATSASILIEELAAGLRRLQADTGAAG